MVATFWISVDMHPSPGHLVISDVHLSVNVSWQDATRVYVHVHKSVLELLPVLRLVKFQHAVDNDEVLSWKQHSIKASDA